MGGTHRQFDRSMQRNPNLVFAREKEVDRNILKRMAGGGAKTMNANLEERFAKKKKKKIIRTQWVYSVNTISKNKSTQQKRFNIL